MSLTKPKFTQIETGAAQFSDPITVLHQGASSANVDVGFLFNRANGLVSNVALYWSESANSIVTSFTTDSGAINSNITATGYANLTIGSLLSINGNIYLNGVMGTPGQFITATNAGTAWTSSSFNGGSITNPLIVAGNVTAVNFIANTGVYSPAYFYSNGTPFVSSTYGNTQVAAYLPTYTGSLAASSDIVTLYANASTQATSINIIDSNLGTATTNITTLFGNAESQQTEIINLWSNAATQSTAIAGKTDTTYVDTAVSTAINNLINSAPGTLDTLGEISANLAQNANTTQAIINSITSTNANVTAANTNIATLQTQVYTNSNVANYLPLYSGTMASLTVDGDVTATNLVANNNVYSSNYLFGNGVNILSTVATYGNTQVAAYLPTYAGSLAASSDIVALYANASTQATSIDTINANLGAYQIYANANASTQATSINSINANLGSYQLYANANVGTISTSLQTLNANVGAFELYANANIGTLYLGNIGTNANLGAYQIYANANASTQATSINSINANLGSYQLYANANIGTINNNLSTLDANVGAYQTWANTSITNLATNANTNTAAYISKNTITAGNILTVGGAYYTNGEQLVTLGNVATATGDIQGFVDRTASNIYFDDATRTYTISPVSGSYTYYYKGALHTISSNVSVTIANTSGSRFIRFDPTNDTLIEGGPIPDFANDVISSYIYFDASAGKCLILGDERHGSKRDTTWHSNQHLNVGTVWRSGGALTYTLNDASAIQIGVGTPLTIADEDLLHTITHSATPNGFYQQVLNTAASLEVLYLNGTTYTSTTASTTPWIAGTSLARYNQITGGSGSLVDAAEGKYITYWLIATNDVRSPVKLVLGRETFDTVDAAYAENFVEYGLSFAEQVFMYQIVVQTSASYANTPKIVIAGVRKLSTKLSTSSAAISATEHNNLTGRDTSDAHTIGAITDLQTTLDAKASLNQTVTFANVTASANIYTDKLYTTNGLYWSGNGVVYSTGSTFTGGYVPNPSTFGSNLVANSGATSGNVTSGALVVVGGVGVSGNVYADKFYTTAGLYWAGNGLAFSSSSSTSFTGGYVPNQSTFGANLVANSAAASTSTTTGALVVVGGAGIGGNLNIGGNAVISNSTLTSARGVATVTGNADGTVIAPNNNGVMLHVTGQTNQPGRFYLDGQGTGAYSAIVGRRYNGTTASPSGLQAGDTVFRLGSTPYHSTGWPSISTTRIDYIADEIQTSTALGSRIEFTYTPQGTATNTLGARLGSNGFFTYGNTVVSNTTSSTSTTTGALVVAGGAGIAGNIYVGGNIQLPSGSIVHVGRNLLATVYSTTVAQFNSSVNNYQQLVMQNLSNGGSASSDFVATADTGTDTTNYIDMGINSSGYNDPAFNVTRALDGYLYTAGGNIAVGTASAGKNLVFHTGGTTTTQIRALLSDTAFTINSTTVSTSVTTGALVVNGGAGIAGNVTAANVSITGNTYYSTGARAPKITVGTTAPSSPAIGDLWVDTN